MDYLRMLRSISGVAARSIRKGLSESEIVKLIANEDIILPDVLRGFFRIVNGQSGIRVGLLPSLSARRSVPLLPLRDLVMVHENIRGTEEIYRLSGVLQKRSSDPGIRDEFWNINWIPFARSDDEGGVVVTYFIDLSPDLGGTSGQVVEEVWQITPSEEQVHRKVVAASLDEFFELLVSRGVVFNEGVGVLMEGAKS